MKYKARYESFFGELPDPNEENEISIICPFHEDQKKSASVNVRSGLFHCFACHQDYNYLQFKKAFQHEHGVPLPEEETHIVKAIPEQAVRDLHYSLITKQEIIDRLEEERGIFLETIKKWQLGWHERTKRIAIPIRDDSGTCVNIRLYSFSQSGSQKMLSWKAGYGKARLWPLENLESDTVVLCEGEMDRLILEERGINAVTSTGGAKTWKSEWSKLFNGMKVYIIYDCDLTGDEGARKAAASIAHYADEVRVVKLDLNKGEDITDFFIHYGYTRKDLAELVRNSPVFKKPVTEEDFKHDDDVQWVTLGRSLMPLYRNQALMMPVIVSARRDERMHFPQEVMFSCNQDAGKICQNCALLGRGEATVEVDATDSGAIDFVGISQKEQLGIVRSRAGIPNTCRVVDVQTTESGTIEEILVTPEIDSVAMNADHDGMYLIQRAFYVGVGLDYNASYVIKSRPIPFHKSSKIVHHVIDAVPAHDSIESFEMSEEIYDRLRKFQAKPGKVRRKLDSIAKSLERNVTKIWDRPDLHIGMDLVWHSVLEFEFDGVVIQRGWLEGIIIGDTRTGKSEVASKLQRHYGLGEIVSGENTTYAGLVGGAIKHDDSWFVKWGRIPLNDRRLVVIDEVTGMPVEHIGLMSGVRETGVADITKIETQKANARTRAIWISNVRQPKNNLGDYEFGCEALRDVIGMPEDIARFDFAISAAAGEVSAAEINSNEERNMDGRVYDSDSCSQLILWAWSRGRDSIQFQREAVEACKNYAMEMGDYYDSKMPLVIVSNQRIKLARMAAAIAARVFSTDDGENLIVTAEHVEVAKDLLNEWYAKRSFGYAQMSDQTDYFADRREESAPDVEEFLNSRPMLSDFLARTKYVSFRKISDNTGVPDHEAQAVIRFLGMTMMVEDRGTHGYFVTNELKAIAKRVAAKQDFDFSYEEDISV